MNIQAGTPEQLLPESQRAARPEVAVTRSFYWAVKRELWEHKTLYVAPLAVIGILLLGLLLNARRVYSDAIRVLSMMSPEQQHAIVSSVHYSIAAVMILVMAVVVWTYCLDALQGERRDRSILFWKSLPVSDLTTVLAKLFVPTVVIPAMTFVAVLVAQVSCLSLASLLVIAGGNSPAVLWAQSSLFQFWMLLLYVLAAMAVWYAPLHAWLLLVSSWARRWALLWALLPAMAVSLLESATFGTGHVSMLIRERLGHGLSVAFHANAWPTRSDFGEAQDGFRMNSDRIPPEQVLDLIDPVGFLSSPGVWMGLVVAAVFIAAAIGMRRYKEPL